MIDNWGLDKVVVGGVYKRLCCREASCCPIEMQARQRGGEHGLLAAPERCVFCLCFLSCQSLLAFPPICMGFCVCDSPGLFFFSLPDFCGIINHNIMFEQKHLEDGEGVAVLKCVVYSTV